MSSPRRVRASRANGRKSRGPVTPDGKERSSLNAITHGLTASTVVLGVESSERFNMLFDACLQTVQPENLLEFTCAEEMAFAKWQLRRAIGIETTLTGLEMDRMAPELAQQFESVPHPLRVALACQRLQEGSNYIANLQRYQSRLALRFERAIKELRTLRELSAHSPADPPPDPGSESAQTTGPATASAAGTNEPNPEIEHPSAAESAGSNQPPDAPKSPHPPPVPAPKAQPKTYYAVVSGADYARLTGRRPRR